MLKKIIPVVLQGVFVFGGVAGGIYAKSSGMFGGGAGPAEEASTEEHGDAQDEKKAEPGHKDAKEEKKHEKAKSGGHGEGGKEGADRTGGVIRFSRQFVVPVIHQDGVNSLLVLDIGIEAPPGSEGLYSYELKLRDAMLAALLKLSNEGRFDEDFIEKGNLAELRASLLVAAKSVIGDNAEQILILSIARQQV